MGSVNASHWSDGRTSSRRVPLSSLVSKSARSVTQPLWRSRVIEPSRPGGAESVGGNHHRLPLWQSVQALMRPRQEHRALRRPTYGSLLDATCWPAMSVQEAVGRAGPLGRYKSKPVTRMAVGHRTSAHLEHTIKSAVHRFHLVRARLLAVEASRGSADVLMWSLATLAVGHHVARLGSLRWYPGRDT